MRERINYIDVIRGIAIIIIVFGHTIVHSNHLYPLYKFFYSFNVPLFFLVSGFLFTSKLEFKGFVKSKFIRLMVPYFIFAVLFLAPYYLLGNSISDSLNVDSTYLIKKNLTDIIYGNGSNSALRQNSSLWFLPALFSTELIFYFINIINNRLCKVNYHIIILVLSALIGFLFSLINFQLFWGINTAISLSVFFEAGILLRRYRIFEKINDFRRAMLITTASGLIGILCCQLNTTVDCANYSYGNYILFLGSSFGLSLAIVLICKYVCKNTIIEHIGMNTMSILIFHKLTIIIFQTKLGILSSLLINGAVYLQIFFGVTVTFISIISSLILAYFIKKIAPVILGEKS